jgi:ABC-type Fe3+/spermidine/putrescine transport system ATPase subunit
MSILYQGRIEQFGTPAQIYNVPVSPFVAEFLGEVNKLEGIVERIEENLLTISLGDAGSIRCQSEQGFPAGKPITCYIRPELMSIALMEKSTETMNSLRAIVGDESFHGSHSRYALKLGNGQSVIVPHKSAMVENGVQNYRKDQSVFIYFPVQSVTLFTSDEVFQ